MHYTKTVLALACVLHACSSFSHADEINAADVDEFDVLGSAEPLPGGASEPDDKKFLEEFASIDGVKVLDDGLLYLEVEPSSKQDAASPTLNGLCKVHYTGRTTDGKVFDSTEKLDEPILLSPASLVPGFREALLRMKEGDRVDVAFPGSLGYGPKGRGDRIAPNAALTFEIHLVEANPPLSTKDQIMAQLKTQVPGIPFDLKWWQAIAFTCYAAIRITIKMRSLKAEAQAQAQAPKATAAASKKDK
mmetsp:Transcript_23302/g.41205  ORF Transcript_23302/g.41205 Transcript_23302/m.41205 type:complete len:247 (+) Transcript_23302:93-833(+)|eukprot:CAMPEP_0184528814 /NCGR_PEP_ID=MMETSP0198_2-20121128/12006_1 /TAXON_ID=1112570 /ORGANISM="Thraustochytrium sp., Strain LLF1b" /LENGTH=246 /DNA_ID=CAMNT_0026920713 /DNA_START=82 /DNA_END=822 /DNA_ORIENTATION=-